MICAMGCNFNTAFHFPNVFAILSPVMLFNLCEKKQSLLEVQFRDVADQKTSGKKLTITENCTTGTQNLVEKKRLMGSNLFTLKKCLRQNCTSWNYILN